MLSNKTNSWKFVLRSQTKEDGRYIDIKESLKKKDIIQTIQTCKGKSYFHEDSLKELQLCKEAIHFL